MAEVRVLERFAPDTVDAVRQLTDAVEARTGTPPFSEVTWLALADGGTGDEIGLLVQRDHAVAAGYAHLARDRDRAWSLELATRNAGEEQEELIQAALGEVATRGGGHVTTWLHGWRDRADDGVFTRAGLTIERDLLQMRVPLPLDESPAWPRGVTVRTFVPGQDEDAWLAVNNRAFASHPEQGGWTRDAVERREAEPWFDPEGFLLAFDDDGLAGFCWTKVHPAHPREPHALGEIYVIGVDPSRQGTGLGRALTVAGLESLAQRGITHGMLYVDGANAAAVGLYTALGFTTARVDRAYGCDVEGHA